MRRMKQAVAAGALAFAVLSANPASAVTLLVKYTPGTDTNGAFSFVVESQPLAIPTSADSFITAIGNSTGQYSGLTSLEFYSSNVGGLFGNYFGAQIYSGSTSAPAIFQSGSFAALFDNNPNLAGTVTISAVPEPATWAMMLIGFGAVGFVMRRRRQTTTVRFQTA